jgi:ferredoxin
VKVEIVTHRDGTDAVVAYDYRLRHADERPMVLDVLLQAQATTMPDLAFRYGCRARNCGVCTIDINGKPRIACRARAREGDRIAPMATLPVLGDLVVRRDGIARQMRGHLANAAQANDLNVEPPAAYHDLTACIECYACLNNCPMHARNFDGGLPGDLPEGAEPPDPAKGYRWGNPFSLLKLQRIRIDPLTTEAGRAAALDYAVALGLEACVGCPGCKCGVGIDLKGQVIAELVGAAKDRLPIAADQGTSRG